MSFFNRETTYEQEKVVRKRTTWWYHTDTAHADELATVSWDELGLEFLESEYKAVIKRIEFLFDVAEPGTPEGDELEKLVIWVEAYEEEHFPF